MITRRHFAREYHAEIAEYSATPVHTFSAEGAKSRALKIVVEPSGRSRWSAQFAAPDPGRRALTALLGTPRLTGLCVVERGTAFLGDVLDPEDFEVVPTSGPVVTAEELPAESTLLLVTPWAITAIGAHGPLWTTQRIAIDGVRIDEASGGWVRGLADPDDDEPREFAVDLVTGRVSGGAVVH